MVIFGIVVISFGIITICLLAIVLAMMRRNARVIRGYLRITDDRVSGLSTLTHGMSVSLEALRRDLDEMEAQRKADAAEMEALRRDLDEMEAQRKADAAEMEAPAARDREREAAMNKAMEEGIANILAYTSGKATGVELRL